MPSQTARVSALIVTVAAGTTLGLTFGQQIVIAHLFGAGNLTDAYLIAQTVPLLLGNQGMLTVSTVAIPLLADAYARGGLQERWRVWWVLLVFTCVVTLTIAAVCALGSTQIIGLLGAGADSLSLQTAQKLFLVMVPVFVCVILSGLPRAMLHAVQNFAVPSSAQLFVPMGMVSAAWLLSARYGIYTLALGAVAGACIMLAVLFVPLRSLRQAHSCQFSEWLPVMAMASKSVLSVLISLSVIQIYLVIGRAFAAGLAAGSVAALGFSASIMSIPLQLFSSTLGTLIFPRVAALVAVKQEAEAQVLILRGLRLALFSVAPFSVFFLLFPVEIVQYVLQRGAFSTSDTARTAYALIGFALGLPGLAVNQVAVLAMIAIAQWSAAAKIGVLSILLDFPLSYWLRASLGLPGVAMGTSIVVSLNAVCLLIVLHRQEGKFDVLDLVRSAWRLLLSALAAAATSRTAFYGLAQVLDSAHYWQGLLLLVASLLTGLAGFGLCSMLVRSKELAELWKR